MSIAKLTARHEAIMRRLVVDGEKAGIVADEFGMTDSRLSIIRNSPLWKEQEMSIRKRILGDTMGRLEALTSKAVDALDSTVVSIDERVRLQSAKEILSRTGFAPTVRIEQDFQPEIKLYIPKGWQIEKDGEEAVSGSLHGSHTQDEDVIGGNPLPEREITDNSTLIAIEAGDNDGN